MSKKEFILFALKEKTIFDCANHILSFLPVELTNSTIRKAVSLWFSNKEEAIKKYGHIDNWNTIAVTDMSCLFENRRGNMECLNISNWKLRIAQ